jgi:predicted enzyme related to lactoylglutathione lyase
MSQHHCVDYFEIPVLELAGAKAFYSAAFGWSFVDMGPTYADIQGAGLAGGLRLVSEPPPQMCGGPLVVIYSDDLAASERAVTAAGATITARQEFPGGKRFHFVDPSGAELAVWTKVDGDSR